VKIDLTETCVQSEQVYSGYLLKVYQDVVSLPDGSKGKREYIRHVGASVVIAEIRPGVLVFERQFRYPVGQEFLELPAGKVDPNDTPLGCAQRELLEETGYSAKQWKHLGVMHPCIGYSNEHIDIFLARGLTAGERKLDDGEFLEVLEMSLDEAELAVLEGRITDAKTIVCLFWARRVLA